MGNILCSKYSILGVDIMEVCEDKYIMVITSNNQAIYLYNELMKKGIKVEIISTPSKITSGCSKSVIFNGDDKEAVVLKAKDTKVKVYGIYKMVSNWKDYDYIKV